MKKFRPFIAVLALALIISSSAGCGQTSNKGQQAASTTEKSDVSVGTSAVEESQASNIKEPIDVTIASWDLTEPAGTEPAETVAKLLREKFGINIKPITLTWDDYQEKIRMLAAANDLPDAFAHETWDDKVEFTSLVNQGMIRSIPEEMWSNCPELKKTMDKFAALEKINGQTYNIPRADRPWEGINGKSNGFLYRKDFAKNLGYDNLSGKLTWKQFEQFLVDIAEKDPDGNKKKDTYALTTINKGMSYLLPTIYTMNGYKNWVYEDGKWIPGAISKITKNVTEWVKNMYDRGVIDPEFSMNGEKEGEEKLCTGKAGVLICNPNLSNIRNARMTYWEKINPDKKVDEYLDLMPLPEGMDGKLRNMPKSYGSSTLISSKVDDDKLSRIVSMIEWLYTIDGYTYLMWGEEGKDFKKVGNTYVTLLTDKDGKPKTFAEDNKLGSLSYFGSWHLDGIPGIQEPTTTDWDIHVDKVLKESYWANNYPLPFAYYMVTPEVSKFNIASFMDEGLVQLIMQSKNFNADWDTYVKKAYSELNVQAAMDEVNAEALKRGIKGDN